MTPPAISALDLALSATLLLLNAGLSLLLGLLLLPVYAWVLSRDRAEAADFAEARRILGDDFPT